MPKAPAKKSTKIAKKKAPATKAVKAKKAKPKLKAKAPSAPPERGFMWKILKRKEEERANREKDQNHRQGVIPENRFRHEPHALPFSKFSGPRRRAG